MGLSTIFRNFEGEDVLNVHWARDGPGIFWVSNACSALVILVQGREIRREKSESDMD